eukprot:TRINITY_DN42565_c0_g1_i1.p1 TRINITY_DN42565_c0_g1~~TRINITY_DN42565_c0_g1_i1.p1  ORF type:complete len:1473 (+),score=263.11 TRINITY_DN42565_c0_g1_i1:143-4420(+)
MSVAAPAEEGHLSYEALTTGRPSTSTPHACRPPGAFVSAGARAPRAFSSLACSQPARNVGVGSLDCHRGTTVQEEARLGSKGSAQRRQVLAQLHDDVKSSLLKQWESPSASAPSACLPSPLSAPRPRSSTSTGVVGGDAARSEMAVPFLKGDSPSACSGSPALPLLPVSPTKQGNGNMSECGLEESAICNVAHDARDGEGDGQTRPAESPQVHKPLGDPRVGNVSGCAAHGRTIVGISRPSLCHSLVPSVLPTDEIQTTDSESDDGSLLSESTATAQGVSLKKTTQCELDRLENQVQQDALDQTLSANYILIGLELDAMESAIALARQEARRTDVVVQAAAGQRRQSLMPRTRGHSAALGSFIPNTLRRSIVHGTVHLDQWKVLLESPSISWYEPVLSRFRSALVFADASGFTKLTETLAKQPQGAERIGATLNGFFGPVIDIVHKHGGDIIKFSGDAITIIWAAEEPTCGPYSCMSEQDIFEYEDAETRAVAAAARFCLEIQARIPEFGETPVPGCSLTMHIGVGFGEVALLQVGGLLGRWEYCVAGQAMDQISIAEPLANSGETVFSPEARAHVEDYFEFTDISDDTSPLGFARLGAPRRDDKQLPSFPPWWGITDASLLDLRLVKRYVPSAVSLRLASSPQAEEITYPEEMRRVSVVFLSVLGLDPFASEPLATDERGFSQSRETQLLMRLMQRSVYALEGSVNKFLVDDKGVLLLVCFGLPPLIHFTDDPVRAVLCAMRLCTTLRDDRLQGRVGVATGQCWCGVVGTSERREYTVLGDVVNLSARLMSKAGEHCVLVDQATSEAGSSILLFQDGGELSLKGKANPVRVFQFVRPRKGLSGRSRELRASLLSWKSWPACNDLKMKMHAMGESSGVLYLIGPGGSGKTELAEEVYKFAQQKDWSLIVGQNMDPSGTFALPRLCLQEAFCNLVNYASKDPYWRNVAHRLLKASVDSIGKKVITERHRRLSVTQTDLITELGHAETYWLLIAMIRESGLSKHEVAELEEWVPLLGLVVTHLAFGPRTVAAMLERDEQSARSNRFPLLCAAVLDGFSRQGVVGKGVLLALHIRRSSAFFQTKDAQEAAAIRAMAALAMRRRAEANGMPEERPLVLCIISRESVLKDDFALSKARECGGCVSVRDFALDETRTYVQHMLDQSGGTVDVGEGPTRRRRASHALQALPRRPEVEVGVLAPLPTQTPKRNKTRAAEIVAEYIWELTGGNSLGVEVMMQELERQKVLSLDREGTFALSSDDVDVHWLRSRVPLPEKLVGMAFSFFERFDPQAQMVLKAASTFQPIFLRVELEAALSHLPPEELTNTLGELLEPRVRGLVALEEGSLKFYSGLLRYVASTLVLETQRTEVRRRTMRTLSNRTGEKIPSRSPRRVSYIDEEQVQRLEGDESVGELERTLETNASQTGDSDEIR